MMVSKTIGTKEPITFYLLIYDQFYILRKSFSSTPKSACDGGFRNDAPHAQ